jgi:hypothetical protein
MPKDKISGLIYFLRKVKFLSHPSLKPGLSLYFDSMFDILKFVSDESGWGVQFDLPPGNPPSNVPTYSAACASNDGCLGQGNCKADFYRRVFNL